MASEAGEIPAKDGGGGVDATPSNDEQKKPPPPPPPKAEPSEEGHPPQEDDGAVTEEAVVVAAAVVDENDDDEDGSTASGSVVAVAAIVEDEPPPTPNTAKIERDLAKKLPPQPSQGAVITTTNTTTATTPGVKKEETVSGAPSSSSSATKTTSSSTKEEGEEVDNTPVKKNITLKPADSGVTTKDNNNEATDDKPVKAEAAAEEAKASSETEASSNDKMQVEVSELKESEVAAPSVAENPAVEKVSKPSPPSKPPTVVEKKIEGSLSNSPKEKEKTGVNKPMEEDKMEKVESEEKTAHGPKAEDIVSATNKDELKGDDKIIPMDIDDETKPDKTPKPADTTKSNAVATKKGDDTEDEDGEIKEETEDGEVEEGEMTEEAPVDKMKPPTLPASSSETKKEANDTEKKGTDNESQVKTEKTEEMPGKKDRKSPEKSSDSLKKEEPMIIDKPAKKSSPEKEKATSASSDAISEVKNGSEHGKDKDKDEEDEDGEIKEETEDEEGEIKEDTEEEGEIKEDTTEEEGEVKDDKKVGLKKEETPRTTTSTKDVEMEDALSQSDDGVADRDADMETASNDGDTASLVDESTTTTSRKIEPTTYSTRGRASGSTTPVPRSEPTAKGSQAAGSSSSGGATSGNKTEQWERSVREALDDLGRGTKEAPPAGVGPGGASFLEALSEEERRTRTRFLPAVDGIHMLRKNEIKGDLALARSIMASNGNVASVASVAAGATITSSEKKKSKKKKHHDSVAGDSDSMDTDDGAVLSSSEDDPAADLGSARVGSASTIEVEGDLLMVPSAAFVPPPAATHSSAPPAPATNGEKKEDGAPAPVASTGVKGILNNQRITKSPKVVESVTAFNPPRPPESAGKQKQHRMLRWERRPADVEVDLNNYRKTVDRTRKELHAAEDELERIEATSNHLRRHFLAHLQCMDQESEEMLAEFNSLQQKCVGAAGLLTSRTRSRGAGKGSHVMRDVLSALKARGAELSEKRIPIRSSESKTKSTSGENFGIGGVGGSGFADLNQHSIVNPQRIAHAWVLPGDKVTTPYGDGEVVKIFENSALNVKAPPLEDPSAKAASNGQGPSKMDIDTPTSSTAKSGSPKSASPRTSSPKSGSQKSSKASKKKKDNSKGPSSEELSSYLGTRICVRLPFGVGYFSPAVVSSKETPDSLSDAQLAKRWGGMVHSALSQAGKLDLNGMALLDSSALSGNNLGANSEGEGATAMDVDGATSNSHGINGALGSVSGEANRKLLPFGSRLIATGTGRGNELFEMNAQKLQKALKPALTDGEGVLGDPSNDGVPARVKDFEEERQESYILQAKVLQLRNELYRQRKIRTFNEKTYTATKEKSLRVESLVAEMRTDLKSLRSRLDEELVELGIDQDRAEAILKSYYLSHDYEEEEDSQEGSPNQKRSRGDASAERHSKRTKVAAH